MVSNGLLISFLVVLCFSCLARAQTAQTRISVAVAGLNGTTIIQLSESGNTLFQLRDEDVTYYFPTTVGTHDYSFTLGSSLIGSTNITQTANEVNTIVLAWAPGGKYQVLTYVDNWNVPEGTAIIRFIHLAPQSGNLVVLGNNTKAPLSYTQATNFISYNSNLQYAWYIMDTNGNTIANEFLFLNDQTAYTIQIQGLPNAVFVTMMQDYPPDEP